MKGKKNAASRLTVAILVRGAGGSLSATLESIAPLGADCLVASIDGAPSQTELDLSPWRARWLAIHWDEDLSAARNACLENATGDHVLWLEPGERLEPASVALLRDWLAAPSNLGAAGTILIATGRVPGELAAEEMRGVRVVPLGKSLRYVGRVRESLEESLAAQGVEVRAIGVRVVRSAEDASWEGRVRAARRQLQLAHVEIEKQGPAARLSNCLGESLAILGDRDGAHAAYRQALASSKRASRDMLEAYCGLIQLIESDPEAPQSAIHLCLEALEVFPLDAQLLAMMGGLLQGAGRLDLAVRSYQAAWRYGEICDNLWHMEGVREVAAVCCSLCRQLQGNDTEAEWVLNEALTMFPGSMRLMRQRLELLIKNGRHDEALGTASQLCPSAQSLEPLRLAIRGACLSREKNWLAARRLLVMAYAEGCRELVCLRWLSLTHLALGDFVAAKPILQEWRHADPDSREADGYLHAIEEATIPAVVSAEDARRDPAEAGDSGKWLRADIGAISPPLPVVTTFSSVNARM